MVKDTTESWMRKAQIMAERFSIDPSTKVGAIIVKNEIAISEGFNDLAPGTPPSYWKERELKYLHVIHAEISAVIRAGMTAQGATLYSSQHPCRECALIIAAAKIATVVCPQKPWRDTPEISKSCHNAWEILLRANIEVRYV